MYSSSPVSAFHCITNGSCAGVVVDLGGRKEGATLGGFKVVTGISVEDLAITDDQATLFYVYSDVISDLGIHISDQIPHAHSTITIQSPTITQSHIIKDLVIKPLSGDKPITLENAITQELPNCLHDIPSQEEISSFLGLSHIAFNFPKKRQWSTILLLGRDCPQA